MFLINIAQLYIIINEAVHAKGRAFLSDAKGPPAV